MIEGQEELEVSSNPQLEALKGLIPEEEIQTIQKKVEPTQNQGNEGQGNNNGEQENEEENQDQLTEEGKADALKQEAVALGLPETATKEEVDAKKAETKKPEVTEKPVKNPLGLAKKKGKENELVIDTPEQAIEIINKKYGQDLKSIKDLPKFFESQDKIRVAAQKAETFEQENLTLRKIWEDLPPEFLVAAESYFKGEDHIKTFTSTKAPFDYKKPVEQQDVKAMVNHYFPGKFTDEDFADAEPSPALQIAKEASLDKFKVEKQTREKESVAIAEKAQKAIEAQKLAANNSLTTLKQSFPEMDKDNYSQIESVINGGQQAVVSYFFNKDGTIKTDAAKRLALAMYGEEQIADFMEIAANQAESRVNEDLVSRGADGPKPKQQGNAPKEQISEETKKKLAELESLANGNKTTY